MSGNRSRINPAPPAAPPGSARQNEYFVPRDGIDREVIQADVCRYLGNDALVRPGSYESDGRVIQGYYITAYRNLTSAMIQDLKADSARWEQERRAASRPAGAAAGGTPISSHTHVVFVRSSNSPPASSRGADGYRSSEIHHQRQHYGPTPTDPSYGDAMAIDPPYSNTPRYPGTGNSGYNGVNSASAYPPAQRYDPGSFPQAGQFPGHQQAQFSTPQAPDLYAGIPTGSNPMVQQPFGQRTPTQDSGPYVHGAQYRQQDPVVTTGIPSRPMYQTTGGPVYPSSTDYSSYPVNVASYSHPIDSFYGRGASLSTATTASSIPAPSDYLASPAGNQQQAAGYSTGPEPKYDESQAPPRSSAPPSSAQAQIQNSSGASSSRRDREQDRLRDRERERDRDRESDRHAAEKHGHRHRTRP